MAKYINAIVELAECGVAVPEFALNPDDLYAGTEAFQAYIKLLRTRDDMEKNIEARYSQWLSMAAGNAAWPLHFVKLQGQLQALDKEAEHIKNTAEARVRGMRPPRLFAWAAQSKGPETAPEGKPVD